MAEKRKINHLSISCAFFLLEHFFFIFEHLKCGNQRPAYVISTSKKSLLHQIKIILALIQIKKKTTVKKSQCFIFNTFKLISVKTEDERQQKYFLDKREKNT